MTEVNSSFKAVLGLVRLRSTKPSLPPSNKPHLPLQRSSVQVTAKGEGEGAMLQTAY
jgi:hypothetical protein